MTEEHRDDEVAAGTGGGLSEHGRERTRAAVSGTIFAMSVLAYLGDHETGTAAAVVTVVGTGIVIFFAEAYAALMAWSLASVPRLRAHRIRGELAGSSTAAAPGLVAGAVLLLADLAGLDVQIAIDIALWLGVAGLTGASILASRAARRPVGVQVGLVVASVVIGTVIVLLKAKLH